MPKKSQIKVVEKKLGRHNCLGRAWVDERIVEIDPRLDAETRLYVLVHEVLHIVAPELDEEAVVDRSGIIARELWRDGWRRGSDK